MTNIRKVLLAMASVGLCFGSESAMADFGSTTLDKATMHKQRATAKNRFIVKLSGTPIIQLQNQAKNKYQVSAFGQNKDSYKNKIQKAEQFQSIVRDDFEAELAAISVDSRTLTEYDTLMNGVAIETPLTLEQVEKLPHVESVFPVRTYKANLMSAVPLVMAPEAWELVGGQSEAGKGIKIAIIDSGITPGHPLFADDGFEPPASRPNDDYCATTDADFCNNKLIAARMYPPYNIDYEETGEFESPKALSGHGTHVAGIAAGREVVADSGETIVGVAPAAYVMAYKALYGQDGSGSDIQLLAALEDAYKDGADVINNSWGGGPGVDPKYSSYRETFEDLEEAGVVLVTAAGNDGSLGDGSIGCPGCVEAGITVGSTTTDYAGSGYMVEFNGQQVTSLPGDNFQAGQSFSAPAGMPTDAGAIGCVAYDEGVVQDKVAVVNRGECTFLEKSQFALTGGAVGVIVINNEPDALVNMQIGEELSIPSVFITMEDGAILKEYIANNPDGIVSMDGVVTIVSEPERADSVSGFSSRGPNGDNGFIKPDLAAPGQFILSGTSREDETSLEQDYAQLSGTSMASPMVAGAAALMLQENPSLTPYDIKGLLIGGVEKSVTGPFVERQATAFETGSGRLNVIQSMELTAYAETANFANDGCVISCTIPNALISIDDVEKTWTASLEFDAEMMSGNVSPAEITLSEKGQSVDFNVNIDMSFDLPQDWYFGRLVWTANTGETITQGFAVANQLNPSPKIAISEVSSAESSAVYNMVTSNPTTDSGFSVELELDGAAEFDADSFVFTPNGTVDNLSVANGVAKYDVNLPAAGYNEVSDLPVDVDLSSIAEATKIACSSGCDEFNQVISIDFTYFNEEQTQITVTDNGVVVVGNSIPSDLNTANNRNLPSDESPDGFLAPFWTDFDLLDSAATSDTGGGAVYYHSVTEGDKEYLVVQWDKVKLWVSEDDGVTADTWGVSSADLEFSFQLVIEKNSSNVWFNYLAIPEQPNFYTTGMESTDSADGYTRWFNGVGTMAANTGDNVRIEFSTAPNLTTQFTVNRSSVEGPFTVNDDVNVDEDSLVVADVLANDLNVERALVLARVGDEKRLEVLFKNQSSFDLLPETLTITQNGEFGDAVVADGKVTYTPDPEYYGDDIVKYSVENSNGKTSIGTMLINVVSVNDLPIINSISAPTSVKKGEKFTISVDATDPDSELFYSWVIPKGFVADEKNAANLELTVDRVTAAEATFTVTVTDAIDSVSQSVTIKTVDNSTSGSNNNNSSSGGGSTSPMLLAFALLLVGVRRIIAK